MKMWKVEWNDEESYRILERIVCNGQSFLSTGPETCIGTMSGNKITCFICI